VAGQNTTVFADSTAPARIINAKLRHTRRTRWRKKDKGNSIAGYGTVIAFAEELSEAYHASLLTETLEEEKETDEKLSGLAKQVNAQAKKIQEGDLETSKKRAKRVA
jgi:Domain of unknown function (DUF892)